VKPLDADPLGHELPARSGAAPSRLRALLAALQLASPALPVGGFAYSQGLEQAIDGRRVTDAASAARWIGDLLSHVLARLEAPLWLRSYDAWAAGDRARFDTINDELLATRETMELRAETQQMGASLARLLPDFGTTPPGIACALPLPEPVAYAAAFACACARLGVDREAGLASYLWAWAENQALVAVKTVPLGHSDGQRLLLGLHAPLEAAVAAAMRLPDDGIGSAPFGATLASMRHETLYSRLYRS
jgi:urease accessory protein